MAGCHVAWMEGGRGIWKVALLLARQSRQTDKINAKVNKDIVVPEKEPEIFLSPSPSLLARWPLSVRLCLVSGKRERERASESQERPYCS